MVSKRQVSTVGLLIPILQPEVEGWADLRALHLNSIATGLRKTELEHQRTGEIYQ